MKRKNRERERDRGKEANEIALVTQLVEVVCVAGNRRNDIWLPKRSVVPAFCCGGGTLLQRRPQLSTEGLL